MNGPNFFILGAPKCGTTALASWLGEHPNVYMSPIKEPHYYSTDISNQQARTREEYGRLFDGVSAEHQAIGEASVWYLYSHVAVANILRDVPDAKFIVCLRNPVEMAFSLHGQQLMAGNENIKDFRRAWEAQEERARTKRAPAFCEDYKLLLYDQACHLGGQMQRLFTQVAHDRVETIFFDDFKSDAAGCYRKVLRFLQVEDDGRTTFPVVNAASERRSLVLRRTMKAVNRFKKKYGLPALGTGLMPVLNKWNRRSGRRARMDENMQQMLKEYFAEDVRQLEAVTGRDLGGWLE